LRAPVGATRMSSYARVSAAFRGSIIAACFLMLCRGARGRPAHTRSVLGHRPAAAIVRRASEGSPFDAGSVGVVLLSSGKGSRMGADIPKQYLKLLGLEIALHSLDTFLRCPSIAEIVIVCAETWRSVFDNHLASCGKSLPFIKYASGGAERQDSVKNGLALVSSEFAAVHDAARPLVTEEEVEKVITDAKQYGAALLAVQTKATIKQSVAGEALVGTTPDRNTLWEAHTPQVIRTDLLHEGFKNAALENLAVTDDVSLVESMGMPVKLTEGEYTNIKVTTPEDMQVAEAILKSRGFVPPNL